MQSLKTLLLSLFWMDLTYAGASTHCLEEQCSSCVQDWYGPNCIYRCPVHCDGGCHKVSGQCDWQCERNYTGRFCDDLCPPNCLEGCDQITATCNGGCHPRFYGKFCNITCDADCHICDRISGECIRPNTRKAPDNGSCPVCTCLVIWMTLLASKMMFG